METTSEASDDPYNFFHALTSMVVEPLVYAIDDAYRHRGVEEIGRAHLDGRSPNHEELDGIGGTRDAAKSHYGNLHSLGHLRHHPQGHRFHGRSAKAACADAEHQRRERI